MNAREMQASEELSSLLDYRDQLRSQENSGGFASPGNGQGFSAGGPQVSSLRQILSGFLPKGMMPGNVGDRSQTAWMYTMPADFAFGTNPLLAPSTSKTVNLQVPSDGGFILLGASVTGDDFSDACLGGPYNVLVQDNQSNQMFMNSPVPIQTLAYRSAEMQLEAPMYFAPSATIGITVSTWLAAGTTMATTGSGNMEVLLYGLLTNVQASNDLMAAILAAKG